MVLTMSMTAATRARLKRLRVKAPMAPAMPMPKEASMKMPARPKSHLKTSSSQSSPTHSQARSTRKMIPRMSTNAAVASMTTPPMAPTALSWLTSVTGGSPTGIGGIPQGCAGGIMGGAITGGA